LELTAGAGKKIFTWSSFVRDRFLEGSYEALAVDRKLLGSATKMSNDTEQKVWDVDIEYVFHDDLTAVTELLRPTTPYRGRS